MGNFTTANRKNSKLKMVKNIKSQTVELIYDRLENSEENVSEYC